MGRTVTIPVRVRQPIEYPDRITRGPVPDAAQTSTPQSGHVEPEANRLQQAYLETAERVIAPAEPAPDASTVDAATIDVATVDVDTEGEVEKWRDRALRLQAEMDNYRKRQRRLAQDQVETERQRLLDAFLRVVDDLERALTSPAGNDRALRQGVELTHREALQLLKAEGAEPIEAEGQPFDPNWHEAVATIGHISVNAAPDTVAQVLEPGYRLGAQLLRPAKVVVAI
jgi:molecular chaperone GrpE